MTGHGRLDYRFDGTSWQGRFQRDAFQKHDGKWVNVWQQTRGLEQKQILDHDVQATPPVRRCACSEMYASRPQQPRLAEQVAKLEESIAMAQNQGYTPFIVADESLESCALKCLTAANLTNHAKQSDSSGQISAPRDLPAPAGVPSPAVEGDEPPNETGETTRPPSAKGLSSAEAAQLAAAPTPAGGVGLTGHVFELPDVTDPRTVGLRTVHHIRPTIVSLSCLPSGLSDDEVCGRVVERFKAHVPMHRTYLILLTHGSTAEPDQY